ncbi:MAG: hypothetical protein EKK42_20385 [Pseudonocardiaceae bacterium]|nr:MAG: hypothetical protein EKK42_20385 [Pseudonocardiaceae bacterium]
MSDMMDLDAQLDQIDVAPKTVKLGGQHFTVRRDLTQVEAARYFELVNSQSDVDALSILVGGADGARLNALLEALPRPRMTTAVQQLMRIAGLLGDEAGE